MKNDDARSWPSAEVIERYLRGKASPEESYWVEKTTLEHPFFADAVRGFVESGEKPNKKDWTPDGTFFERKNKEMIRGLTISLIICIAISSIYIYMDHRSDSAIYLLEKASTSNALTEKDPIELENYRGLPILTDAGTKDSSMRFNVDAPELNTFPKQEAFVRNFTAPEPLEPQPTELIDSTQELEKALTLPTNAGSIYHIADFKVVDYRGIRTVTATIPVILTGTPAAQGERNTSPLSIQEKQQVPYVDYLEKTMFQFAQGRYKDAYKRFYVILNHYPNDANALFYGGMCNFYEQNYEKATLLFAQSANHQVLTFHAESIWYNALAMWESGNNSAACELIRKVASEEGFYSSSALEWLETNQCP